MSNNQFVTFEDSEGNSVHINSDDQGDVYLQVRGKNMGRPTTMRLCGASGGGPHSPAIRNAFRGLMKIAAQELQVERLKGRFEPPELAAEEGAPKWDAHKKIEELALPGFAGVVLEEFKEKIHQIVSEKGCPGVGGGGPPCCDRMNEYNGFPEEHTFICPKSCPCHD